MVRLAAARSLTAWLAGQRRTPLRDENNRKEEQAH